MRRLVVARPSDSSRVEDSLSDLNLIAGSNAKHVHCLLTIDWMRSFSFNFSPVLRHVGPFLLPQETHLASCRSRGWILLQSGLLTLVCGLKSFVVCFVKSVLPYCTVSDKCACSALQWAHFHLSLSIDRLFASVSILSGCYSRHGGPSSSSGLYYRREKSFVLHFLLAPFRHSRWRRTVLTGSS